MTSDGYYNTGGNIGDAILRSSIINIYDTVPAATFIGFPLFNLDRFPNHFKKYNSNLCCAHINPVAVTHATLLLSLNVTKTIYNIL